jgi:hypothetical protein
LTFLSIVANLQAAGEVVAWETSDGDLANRCFYAAAGVVDFYCALDPQARRRSKLSAKRQLTSFMDGFVLGDSLDRLEVHAMYPVFVKLSPKTTHVWEIRLTDLRVFGWFPGPSGTFVAVSADWKHRLLREGAPPEARGWEDPAKYAAHRRGVEGWRTRCRLDHHVWGGERDDELRALLG